MRRTLFHGTSAIVLIAIAVLASTAALGVPIPREVYATVASLASAGERSVGRADEQPTERRDAVRAAMLRAPSPAISRAAAPSGAGTGSSRGGGALGVASPHLALAVLHAPGERIDVRRDGAPSPDRPTPPSRAPPLI